VPDNLDYEWLGWLVDHPEEWSAVDARKAEWLIGNQRSAISGMHPKDVRRRHSVVDRLETALAGYRHFANPSY
jgi:hypothetical protein